MLERTLFGFLGHRAVKIGIGQEGFRSIGARLQEIFTAACKAQVALTDNLQAAFAAQVAPGLIGFNDCETSALSVKGRALERNFV